jgi:hypothetical protein
MSSPTGKVEVPADAVTKETEAVEPVPKDEKATAEPTMQDDKSSDDAGHETGEASEAESDGADEVTSQDGEAPPLPKEPTPDGPPLPTEPAPQPEDDGWDCQWDPNAMAWYFYNRFTGKSQWDNPRVPAAAAATAPGAPGAASTAQESAPAKPAAGGYNPAIHGDYDPNAWYAKAYEEDADPEFAQEEYEAAAAAAAAGGGYDITATFNRVTGQFQTADMGPGRHTDEAKSRRQMNSFFDVDAAANAHDGRSLKAERSNQRISKSELKHFKEKRRARKEEKRRAWLRE